MRMFIIISVVIILLIGVIYISSKSSSSSSSKPQQPTSQPQQPTSKPQQPTSQPQQPTSQPQQPTSQPQQPTSQPQQPTSQPQQPTMSPIIIMPQKTIAPIVPIITTPPLPPPPCNNNGEYNLEYDICDCNYGSYGKNCEYSRENTCNGNGIPIVDNNGNFQYCMCDVPNSEGIYCCSTNNPTYRDTNKCTEIVQCSSSKSNGGWVKTRKMCKDIDLRKSECQVFGQGLTNNINSLRCNTTKNGGFVSAKTTTYDDLFLESLFYPPNENNPINKKYWLVIKTDRDIRQFSNDIGEIADLRSNYGSFFIAHKFKNRSQLSSDDICNLSQSVTPSPSELDKIITNKDLNDAIDSVYSGISALSFDNFGNIAIRILSSSGEQQKTFRNPLFPCGNESKITNTNPTLGPGISLNENICRMNGYNWDSNSGECHNFGIDTSSSKNPYDNEPFRLMMNRKFITTKNRKWIIYRDDEPIGSSTPVPSGNYQYYLLYNPIQSTSYKTYYNKLAPVNITNTTDTSSRMREILVKKYGEINAAKGTYDVGMRQYGDPTSRCTNGYIGNSGDITLPDCAAGVFGKTGFIPSSGYPLTDFNNIKGSCACLGTDCLAPEDSYVNEYTNDIRRNIFGPSANDTVNRGKCPSSLSINICNMNISSGGNTSLSRTQFQNSCGNSYPNVYATNTPRPFTE